jgi:hypothetical protein
VVTTQAALLVNGFKTHMWAEMICAHIYCWGVPLICTPSAIHLFFRSHHGRL